MADGVRPAVADVTGEGTHGAAEARPGGDPAQTHDGLGATAGDAAEERRARWLAENADAIEAWNAWTEERGLPLEAYRTF